MHLPAAQRAAAEWEGGWETGAAPVKMSGRAARGSARVIYSHMRSRGRKEWTEGWLGMPEEEEKENIFTIAEQQ